MIPCLSQPNQLTTIPLGGFDVETIKCGDQEPILFYSCALPEGHEGSHQSESGKTWEVRDKARVGDAQGIRS